MHARGHQRNCRSLGKQLTLKAVAGLRLLSDDVKDRVNELCSLCVMSLGPVIASTSLQFKQYYQQGHRSS